MRVGQSPRRNAFTVPDAASRPHTLRVAVAEPSPEQFHGILGHISLPVTAHRAYPVLRTSTHVA